MSGTPPQTMLASPALIYPTPNRVAGDDNAGFYRREFQDGRRWDGVEAFSWGGLTSGGPLRALWLVLAPFLFANVAFWTAPVPLGIDKKSVGQLDYSTDYWWIRRASEAVQRLLALALTASLVLGAVTAAMDIIGWQYVRGQRDDIAWLAFLKWGAFQGANRQLIVSAAAPLLLMILLWVLARYTWARLESVKPTPVSPTSLRSPLEDRRMWNGQGPVARLRAVHVSFGIALVGLALLAPLLLNPGGLDAISPLYVSPWGLTVPVVGGALVVLLAGLIILVLFPFMSDRKRSDETDTKPAVWFALLPWIALTLTVLAAAALLIPGVWDSAYPTGTSGSLPGIVMAIALLFAIQGGLILLLVGATAMLRRAADVDPCSTVPPVEDGTPANLPPAWFGMTPAVLSTLGWLLGASWAAAVSLFLVKAVGGNVISSAAPQSHGLDATKALIVPAPFVWAAAATAVVAVLGILLVAMVVFNYARHQMLDLDTHIDAAYAGADELPPDDSASTQRFRQIRRAWLLGEIPQIAERSIWALVVLMWVTVIAGVVGYLVEPTLVSSYPIAYRVGAVVLLGILSVTIWLGRRTYSDSGTRKTIGILWDVGSFWPRATHPLAPPCYAERAVPDLTRRVEYYCNGNAEVAAPGTFPVVLSCHSQGSIIGAATLLQLRFDDSAKLCFLTYGSPLRRLHARCFPAYFGPATLSRIGILLRRGGDAQGTRVTADIEERRRWRWRNLYRPTDPVGGPVFVARRVQSIPPQLPPQDIDWNLRDPLSFDKRADNTSYDAASGHSNYPLDPGYAVALASLLGPPISTPRGVEPSRVGGC